MDLSYEEHFCHIHYHSWFSRMMLFICCTCTCTNKYYITSYWGLQGSEIPQPHNPIIMDAKGLILFTLVAFLETTDADETIIKCFRSQDSRITLQCDHRDYRISILTAFFNIPETAPEQCDDYNTDVQVGCTFQQSELTEHMRTSCNTKQQCKNVPVTTPQHNTSCVSQLEGTSIYVKYICIYREIQHLMLVRNDYTIMEDDELLLQTDGYRSSYQPLTQPEVCHIFIPPEVYLEATILDLSYNTATETEAQPAYMYLGGEYIWFELGLASQVVNITQTGYLWFIPSMHDGAEVYIRLMFTARDLSSGDQTGEEVKVLCGTEYIMSIQDSPLVPPEFPHPAVTDDLTENSSDVNSSNLPMVLAIVGVVIVLILIIVFVVLIVCRRKRAKKDEYSSGHSPQTNIVPPNTHITSTQPGLTDTNTTVSSHQDIVESTVVTMDKAPSSNHDNHTYVNTDIHGSTDAQHVTKKRVPSNGTTDLDSDPDQQDPTLSPQTIPPDSRGTDSGLYDIPADVNANDIAVNHEDQPESQSPGHHGENNIKPVKPECKPKATPKPKPGLIRTNPAEDTEMLENDLYETA